MLSTLLLMLKNSLNKAYAARRKAAWIFSVLGATESRPPLTNETLAYGCMAGIVMLIRHDIVPRNQGSTQD